MTNELEVKDEKNEKIGIEKGRKRCEAVPITKTMLEGCRGSQKDLKCDKTDFHASL